MKGLLLILLVGASSLGFGQAPTIQWQKTFGGTDYDVAWSICQTFEGGYVVVGRSDSNDGDITDSRGEYDYWVVKLNENGVQEWQKSLGGTSFDWAYSIEQTTDSGYILAGTSSSSDGDITNNVFGGDYWVVKLDEAGLIEWEKSLGGSGNDIAHSIKQTLDGGYIVAGESNSDSGDITGHHGDMTTNDYWVVKLDESGTIEWQKSLGGINHDLAFSIEQTLDSGYIVAGISESSDGDVTFNHGFENSDFWIVKLDGNGTLEWEKSFGGTDNDLARCVKQTSDGGYIVVGGTDSNDGDVTGNHGGGDYWVIKLSNTGTLEWQKILGGTGYDNPWSINQTLDGGYVVGGHSSSPNGDVTGNHGGSDYWVVKLNAVGNIVWQKSLGGTAAEAATNIKQTLDEGYVIVGMSSSTDGDVTGNQGGGDYWVVKLSPEPVGIGNANEIGIRFALYPNPATTEITVNGFIPVYLKLCNALGQTVAEASKSNKLYVGNLPQGLYVMQMFDANGQQVKTEKVIVAK
jgi:hypothetical protein